jgi:16S rRNA (guanine(1405)-N(7))-methyltransferase
MFTERETEAIVASIKESKKYADTYEATIRELVAEEVGHYKKARDVAKAVRKRLHSIMAPYLGDPDYEAAAAELEAAFAAGGRDQIRAVCRHIMGAHLSTRERLPILDGFYTEVFDVTGQPGSILDVACGLNPLAFPWMDLPADVDYVAYDIHEPRVDFINHYFRLQGLRPLARLQDVAINVPQETADLALFLKEMPRFERNYRGQGRPLLAALRVRHLVVSFPTVSTHGGRDLTGRYRVFFHQLVAGQPWSVTELLFESELVFCVDKGGRET